MIGPHSVEWKQRHYQLREIERELFRRTGYCATVEQVLDKLNEHSEFVDKHFPGYVQRLGAIDAHLIAFINGQSKIIFKDEDGNKVYKVYKTKQAFNREYNAYQFMKRKYPHKTILAETQWYQGWCEQIWCNPIDAIPEHLSAYITDSHHENYGQTQSGETVILDWENLAFDYVGMFWRDLMETNTVIDIP